MSDNILQPDPEALHQSAIDILTHVSNVMEQGSTLLKEHDLLLAENQSDYRLGNEIEAVEQDLRYVKSDLEKVKQRELTMTVVAPTSAGKSMIINTIAGQELLPSRKTPMTILPTEIVFSQSATQAKLILNETLMSHLLEVWRQLHDRIQQIGEMEAINRATNAGFICEDLINQIAKNPTPAIESESIGSQLIESNLTTVNDVFRLANILGISTNFLSSLTQIPRIEAPFHAKLSSLKSLDKLVLVDTPGITEYNSSNLTDIVKDRLKASTLILVVVDYNTIGDKNQNEVKILIDEIATLKGRDLIYIAVNKIDERDNNNSKHLTTAQILDIVKNQYQIADPEHRVFELSGMQAFLAVNFWHDFSQPNSMPLLDMPTVQALGSKYHSYSWKKKQSTIDVLEIQEMAEEFWHDSEFDRFINKAIAPLVADVKPSLIGIKAALKDTCGRLSDFQSCLERQKEMIDQDIHGIVIKKTSLKFDLKEAGEIQEKISINILEQNDENKIVREGLEHRKSQGTKQIYDELKQDLKKIDGQTIGRVHWNLFREDNYTLETSKMINFTEIYTSYLTKKMLHDLFITPLYFADSNTIKIIISTLEENFAKNHDHFIAKAKNILQNESYFDLNCNALENSSPLNILLNNTSYGLFIVAKIATIQEYGDKIKFLSEEFNKLNFHDNNKDLYKLNILLHFCKIMINVQAIQFVNEKFSDISSIDSKSSKDILSDIGFLNNQYKTYELSHLKAYDWIISTYDIIIDNIPGLDLYWKWYSSNKLVPIVNNTFKLFKQRKYKIIKEYKDILEKSIDRENYLHDKFLGFKIAYIEYDCAIDILSDCIKFQQNYNLHSNP